MFPNQECYADYLVTYLDNYNQEKEVRIMCPFMHAEEYFAKEYKGKYIKILKCTFKNFLLQ